MFAEVFHDERLNSAASFSPAITRNRNTKRKEIGGSKIKASTNNKCIKLKTVPFTKHRITCKTMVFRGILFLERLVGMKETATKKYFTWCLATF